MRRLTREEILSKEEYERARPEFRRDIMVQKDKRRVAIGEHCAVHFENRDTMRYQIQEMLRAEDSWDRPGAVDGELQAYNPIVPERGELSATLMLECATPEERARFLPGLVGIDRHVWIEVGETEPVLARFDESRIDERKVSSVQYIKFALDEPRRRLLETEGTVVRLRITHPLYRVQAVLSEETRLAIMHDPD